MIHAVVVIPARNEEAHIGGCLAALAAQTLGLDAFTTVVVLDACTDATAAVAAHAARRAGLRIGYVLGSGCGAGAARRAGMDRAAEELFAAGRPDGLIACTDADSVPAPDWLERQLAHVALGAEAIAGLIELDPAEADALPPAVLHRRESAAAMRLARVRTVDPAADHHHFAGASLAVTAAAYRAVGGMEPLTALEDAAFAERLRAAGVAVVHAADVRVRTSARTTGRAGRGLAVDLDLAVWLERRRYRAEAFGLDRLADLRGGVGAAAVIPTKECVATVAGVLEVTVAPLLAAGVLDEVIVVDAGSRDGTARIAERAAAGLAAAGERVRVLQQNELLPELGPARGKGDAMYRAVSATDAELIVFLDGDTADPDPRHAQGVLGPLLADPELVLVKGSFARPLRTPGGDALPHEGGRVTELMARPLLNFHEPRLAGFAQPLAGEFAVRRAVLEQLSFPVGYGVEIAILIDVVRAHGLDALAECDLGTRQNRHQPLRALGEMAYGVLAAVERRVVRGDADGTGAAAGPVPGPYVRPWEDGAAVEVPVAERAPLAARARTGVLVADG